MLAFHGMPQECRRFSMQVCFIVNSGRRRNDNTALVSAIYDARQGNIFVSGNISGFGGLGVSAMAFGTQVRGFKPGRSRRIFQGEKSSARFPSEGK
jgi:hypothetical protein